MKSFRLRIVTPDQIVFDGDVESVQFMGLDGSYGILAGHAPLMTATRPGVLRYRVSGGDQRQIVVTDGFAEMAGNVLTIVAEAGERAKDIDLERARAAEKRARDILAHRGTLADEDVLKAEEALRRAMVRQLAGQQTGSSADR